MNKCDKCGFLHYRTDPCRGAKKSTAALKEVPSSLEDSPFARGKGSARGAKAARDIGSNPRPIAGTQALPVDNNAGSLNGRAANFQAADGSSILPPASKPRGRPSTGFDKRAYNKQYMADRRAGKR